MEYAEKVRSQLLSLRHKVPQLRGVGRESLFAWPEVFAPAFKYLLADHGAAVAFHRGIVAGS
jgi:hypothetical protein